MRKRIPQTFQRHREDRVLTYTAAAKYFLYCNFKRWPDYQTENQLCTCLRNPTSWFIADNKNCVIHMWSSLYKHLFLFLTSLYIFFFVQMLSFDDVAITCLQFISYRKTDIVHKSDAESPEKYLKTTSADLYWFHWPIWRNPLAISLVKLKREVYLTRVYRDSVWAGFYLTEVYMFVQCILKFLK